MRIEAAKNSWMPIDVEDLEPAADDVVRTDENTLVVAGPGAGKTELLAQRACFLLQTNTCPEPRRILAISFKRDAARNLRDRVMRRCGRELAYRFDSYTFDSFCKNLVDRFLFAIPVPFRPTADYQVLTIFNEKKALEFIRGIPSAGTNLTRAQIEGLGYSPFWRAFVGRPLPTNGHWENASDEQTAAADLWEFLLQGSATSAVTFPMLGRMAELLVRTNPLVLAALQKSYRFVFLDEFQDTTSIHYSLIRTAFMNSDSVLTAVGDHKQRIMGWAGALTGVFEQFTRDFGARVVHLERNYRSAQKLVKIQSVIAKALDPNAVDAISMDNGDGGTGECRVLAFDDEAKEAQRLAEMIQEWIAQDGIAPRDICVLCRMKPPVYTERLREALAKKQIRSRVENEFQDLLAEPLSECLLDMLKLACRQSAPESWGRTVALMSELGGDESDTASRRIVDSLLSYSSHLKKTLDGPSESEDEIEAISKNILKFIGEAEFRTANPQYTQGDWYEQTLKAMIKVLGNARKGRDWSQAINEVEGVDSVPIMTTHKSKGLEYHTIIFVGLEDNAHFGFANNTLEEMCGFFVALSRAKKRVIFTFSGVRPTGRGGTQAIQGRTVIKPVYDLLNAAGIELE